MPAALVTGTFNPPHMGHVKLVKAAIEKRDHVVVVVLALPHDRVSAEARAHAYQSKADDALSKLQDTANRILSNQSNPSSRQ